MEKLNRRMNKMKTLAKKLVLLLALLLASAPAFADVQIPYPNVVYQNGTYAINQSTYINASVLAAGVAESQTVPTGPTGSKAQYVLFSSSCDFYANFRGTAAVPAVDVTGGTASELNPLFRFLGGTVSTISLITGASACVVTLQYYYQS